jgi:hypothetical protein
MGPMREDILPVPPVRRIAPLDDMMGLQLGGECFVNPVSKRVVNGRLPFIYNLLMLAKF